MARHSICVARAAAFGLVLICLTWTGAVDAGPNSRGDCPTTPPCIPQAKTFGYFETRWREWPGQGKPEEKFPRSVGAEVMPTPPGQEQMPLPRATPLPSKPPTTGDQGGLDNLLPLGPQPKGQLPGIEKQGPDILPLPGGIDLLKPDTLKPQEKPKDTVPGKTQAQSDQPAANKSQEKPDSPIAPIGPSAKEPTFDGGLPGLAPPEKLVPQLRPTLSTPLPAIPIEKNLSPIEPGKTPPAGTPGKPVLPQSNSPKPIDSGATESSQPDGLPGESQKGPRLQANWDSALYPESTGSGDLRLTGAKEEISAPDPQAGLDGYCPVQLCEHERWVQGNPKYKVRYHGQIFLLSGPEEQKRFLATPRRYAPAFDGDDRVVATEEARRVPGKTECSAIYNKRVYLFSNPITLKQFREDPDRYTKVSQ